MNSFTPILRVATITGGPCQSRRGCRLSSSPGSAAAHALQILEDVDLNWWFTMSQNLTSEVFWRFYRVHGICRFLTEVWPYTVRCCLPQLLGCSGSPALIPPEILSAPLNQLYNFAAGGRVRVGRPDQT